MENFYFTFGTDEQFPYGLGEYVLVRANDWRRAVHLYQAFHPNVQPNTINCAMFYSQEDWDTIPDEDKGHAREWIFATQTKLHAHTEVETDERENQDSNGICGGDVVLHSDMHVSTDLAGDNARDEHNNRVAVAEDMTADTSYPRIVITSNDVVTIDNNTYTITRAKEEHTMAQTRLERIHAHLDEAYGLGELIDLNNEMCEHDYGDFTTSQYIHSTEYDFDDAMSGMSPLEIARAVYDSGFDPYSEYFIFDGCDEIHEVDPRYIDTGHMAEWMDDNNESYGDDTIELILEVFDTEGKVDVHRLISKVAKNIDILIDTSAEYLDVDIDDIIV